MSTERLFGLWKAKQPWNVVRYEYILTTTATYTYYRVVSSV